MIRRMLPVREGVLLLVLVVLFIVFALRVEGFLDPFGLLDRTRHWVVTGMIAVPMTFIIATAGIDLSVGSMLGMCGIVLGVLFRDAGWPIYGAALAAVGVGLVAGAFNGFISSYLRIPPLVVTLATLALYRGVAMGLSKGHPISSLPSGFIELFNGDLLEFDTVEYGPVFVPSALLALAAAIVIGWALLRRSWVGRFTECIGENETAARFAAIDVRRMKLALYAASGLVCGIASLFYTALYATARADAGRGLELEVIAAVVIGGTRISGGSGSVVGSLLGLLVIGILSYGLEMAGIKTQNLVIILGVLLIATAAFNEWMARRSGANA
jgi:rhamnose transport system permease protein